MHVGGQGLMNALSLKTVAMQTHRDLESAVLKGRFAGGRCYGYSTVRAFHAAGTPLKGERDIHPAEVAHGVRLCPALVGDNFSKHVDTLLTNTHDHGAAARRRAP